MPEDGRRDADARDASSSSATELNMVDSLNSADRSRVMRSVRSKGNLSTERVVEAVLRAQRISGWRKHPKNVEGCPDFYFAKHRLVIFVDGCFWHACPKCGRIPKSNLEFWTSKIDGNCRRDNRVRRRLRRLGYHVIRVWEHEARNSGWIARVRRMLDKRAESQGEAIKHDTC